MNRDRTIDVSDMGLLEALRVNPRRLAAGDMRRLLREAADEILRLSQSFYWRPIETAPRDGSRVLVVWGGSQILVATWNSRVNNWQEYPNGDFQVGVEVTHWCRLPVLPRPPADLRPHGE